MGDMASVPIPQGWTWDDLVERLDQRVDLEPTARAKGAIIRVHLIKTGARLPRLILGYVLSGLSPRGTAVWADHT